MEIEELYTELKEKINSNRLKEISAEIIDEYKDKNVSGLSDYASLLNIDSSGLSLNSIFSKIIQTYHPDKLNRIIKEIEKFYAEKNLDQLLNYKKIYLFRKFDKTKRKSSISYDVKFYEEYTFDQSDFGYYEERFDSVESGDENAFEAFDSEENDFEEQGFIEAVNSHFFGNLDFTITKGDLNNLDGELDLSDDEICDLNGIENCINLVSLNLSGNKINKIERLSKLTRLEVIYLAFNEIDDIRCLAGLKNMRELDLSYNEIEDISPLSDVVNLEYVNVIGNPIKDTAVISDLRRKGIIVIY